MNILICENQKEQLGNHVIELQKVFSSSIFSYAQTTLEAIDKIKTCPMFYDFVLCREDRENKIDGENIYKTARTQNFVFPFVLLSNKTPQIEENINDDFFRLSESCCSKKLDKIVDILTSKACQ